MILTLNLITDNKFTDRLIEDCHLFYLRVFKDNYEVPKRLESLFDLKDKIDDKVVAKVSMSAVKKKPNKVTKLLEDHVFDSNAKLSKLAAEEKSLELVTKINNEYM
jgi:hypothetical protein